MPRLALLILTLGSIAFAQNKPITRGHVASETGNPPEFLQVKLGKTLAEQFPECERYDAVHDSKSRRDRDRASFRCYNKELGYIFDHDTPFYPGIVTTADEFEADYRTALAHTETDSDTQQVGYVGTSYSMDRFEDTLVEVKAKRGQPTSCTARGVQNMMGAHFKQVHCEWKQPWGVIAVTAPSDDDLTLFDIWAVSTRHIQLRKQERLEYQRKNSNPF